MTGFFIGAIAVVVLWIVISVNSKAKAHQAFNALDAAQSWFNSEGIDHSSVRFSAYNDSELASNYGATVLVGEGKKDGSPRGFVLEVTPDQGVVHASYVDPAGYVSNHKAAAQNAKATGRPLYVVLVQMAERHRQQFPARGA